MQQGQRHIQLSAEAVQQLRVTLGSQEVPHNAEHRTETGGSLQHPFQHLDTEKPEEFMISSGLGLSTSHGAALHPLRPGTAGEQMAS